MRVAALGVGMTISLTASFQYLRPLTMASPVSTETGDVAPVTSSVLRPNGLARNTDCVAGS